MTWKLAVIVATLATAATVSTQVLSTPKATSGEKGLTQVAGLKVGHVTLSERPTGCTVVLVDGAGAVGGVSQRGAAPGNRGFRGSPHRRHDVRGGRDCAEHRPG